MIKTWLKQKILGFGAKIIYWLASKSLREKMVLQKLGYQVLTNRNSYLAGKSFADSLLKKEIPDKVKDAHPWMNFPLVEFLNTRLNAQHTVFEYGSGLSSLYFAERVKAITSVEHNKDWYDRTRMLLDERKNADVVFFELNNEYPDAIRFAGADKKYDIVVIDGRMRNSCIEKAVDFLTTQGVIILDDSDRPRYEPAFSFLKDRGYKFLTFCGMKPGQLRGCQGSIFYKSGENCFGI
jgi:protein-L-isoaspartate O-methyltransferase